MAGGIEPGAIITKPEVPVAEIESIDSADGEYPTEEEKRTLRRVADRLPWSAFIVAVVELCER